MIEVNSLNISLLGTRGIPSNYGGFETALEEIAPRLVEMGHQVTVYCRTNNIKYLDDVYKGVKLVKLPTISNKNFDTIVHSLFSTFHVVFLSRPRPDVCIYFGPGNAMWTIFPRITGIPTAINIDGLDWKRKKWGRFAKQFLRNSEKLACRFANRIITDANVIRDYYMSRYQTSSVMIPYGCNPYSLLDDDPEILAKYGLENLRYVFYVGRLEPENNVDVLVKAFTQIDSEYHLVIVGDVPSPTDYSRKLKATNHPRIHFTGFVYGRDYKVLSSLATIYVQPTEVGGTHPALVEAMAYGNCVVVNGTPENLEVIGDVGFSYPPGDVDGLKEILTDLFKHPEAVKEHQERALKRATETYNWNRISRDYLQVCWDISKANGGLDK